MNSNRFDQRSRKEFKKAQIKQAHKREAEIALRLAIKLHAENGKWPEIKGLGTDFTGEFIEDDKKITAEPDFLIDNRIVEITCSRTICPKIFHEKRNKVDKMLKDGTEMVFVNGLDMKSQPDYIWLKSDEWKPFVIRSDTKYGTVPMLAAGGWLNKNSYRFDIYWFRDLFKPLPAMIDKVKKMYPEIAKIAK